MCIRDRYADQAREYGKHREYHQRYGHGKRRLVRVLRVMALLPQERNDIKPEHVKGRHEGRNYRRIIQKRVSRIMKCDQYLIFGPESSQGKYTRDRKRRYE